MPKEPYPDLPPVAQRFLRYVRIDTQSDPSSSSVPSTEKQKDLSRVLVGELRDMGYPAAQMDENGYVTCSIGAIAEDGARLSESGLPTPNIFNGGYDYHSRFEWNTVENIEHALAYTKKLVEYWGRHG